jgi:hypothetical protein
VKGLILLILGTDRIMADPIMADPITADPIMGGGIRPPLQSTLATGRIILVVLAITWAVPITFGGLDIGDGATAKESGSTAITSCEDSDRAVTARQSTLKRLAAPGPSVQSGNAQLLPGSPVRNARFCEN